MTPTSPPNRAVPYESVSDLRCAFCGREFVNGELVLLYEENEVPTMAFCRPCGRQLSLRPGTMLLRTQFSTD